MPVYRRPPSRAGADVASMISPDDHSVRLTARIPESPPYTSRHVAGRNRKHWALVCRRLSPYPTSSGHTGSAA